MADKDIQAITALTGEQLTTPTGVTNVRGGDLRWVNSNSR